MADEFRRDAAGFGGNDLVRTPCLDGLAESARVFENASTPSPVCVPARQCMATGRFARSIGCDGFHSDLAPGAPTFARHFADHGYYTVACGKLHHRGPDQMQGWLHRIGSETAVRWPEKFSSRSQIGRRSWLGTEDVRSAGPGLSPLALHDDLTVQGTCDFLRMHFGGMYPIPTDIPLLLTVSLWQPHFPLLADPDFFDYYLPRVRPTFQPTLPDNPVLRRKVLDPAPDDESIRRATAAYASMVEATDRRFARVLETLREVGQNPDDWLIAFTSDHGDMLGDHGCWEKRSFYESSVGIPLFLRGPGIEPGRSGRISNLIDLFPTLCSLAGLPVPDGLDGRDLFTPASETLSQLGPSHFLFRSGSWKLFHFGEDGPDALFDLATDPDERFDRAGDPACRQILENLRLRLSEVLRNPRSLC